MSKIKRIAAVLLAFVLAFAVLPASEAKAAESITFTGLGDRGAQDNLSRYLIRFTGLTAAQIEGVHAKPVTIQVDGEERTGASFYNLGEGNGTIAFLLPYGTLQEGATMAPHLEEHNVLIPAGTVIGDYTLAADFKFYVNEKTIEMGEYTSSPVTIDSMGSCGAQDNGSNRYMLRFRVPAADRAVLHDKFPTLYINGEKRTDTGAFFYYESGADSGSDADTIWFFVPYDALVSGATVASALPSCKVELKAGTTMGPYALTEDYTFYLDQYSVTTPITFTGLGEGGAQDVEAMPDQPRYFLRLAGVDDAMLASLPNAAPTLYVDGEQKDTGAFFWNLNEDNGQIGFFIPYAGLKEGAQYAHELEPHTIEIKEGTILGNYKVVEDFKFYVHKYGFGEGEIQHTYDQQVQNEATLVSAAECGRNAVYKYSCTCGEIGTETFEAENTALSHTGGTATCTAQAVCELCGEGYGELAAHTPEETVKKATFSANGSITTVCSACDAEISKTTIAKVSSAKLSTTTYAYNGKVKTPSVTVKAGSKTLKKNVDYTVTLGSGRKAVGKYRVTITLKGNYSGKKYLYFTINPTETKVSKVKAEKKAVKVYFSKKTKEVTGYQIQYSTSKKFSGAKTKTLTKNTYSSYTVKSLKAKKTYYVRVRTYKTVGKTKFYSDWSNVKSAKTK